MLFPATKLNRRNELTPRLEEILTLMLKRGADVEMRNKWGETPLHNTCKRGNLETTVYLLNNGADINAIDNFGETGNAAILAHMVHLHK
jgi:ankyrin repeat protein